VGCERAGRDRTAGNKFGVDLSKQQQAETEAWYSPSMYNIVQNDQIECIVPNCLVARQIADSITAFGFNVPILIDRDGNVIAGHGRLLAAKQLGWREVPTLCLDHLSRAHARAFMIADNRLTEIASWDDRLLAQADLLRPAASQHRHAAACTQKLAGDE
jgi:ParB-like chromosome segregation protein Spo0J